MPFPLPEHYHEAARFEMMGKNHPAYFALTPLYDDEAGERNYLASLVYVDFSATSQVWGIDRAEFRRYFEDLSAHRGGWDGEKRVANLDGELSIGCEYDGDRTIPEARFVVRLALDHSDPFWVAQLRVDVRADALEDLAWRSRLFFGGGA